MGITSPQMEELAEFIRKCEKSQPTLGKAVLTKLAAAKLKMACLVLRSQRMEPTLDNIASILGPDFGSVIPVIKQVKDEMGADGPVLPK